LTIRSHNSLQCWSWRVDSDYSHYERSWTTGCSSSN